MVRRAARPSMPNVRPTSPERCAAAARHGQSLPKKTRSGSTTPIAAANSSGVREPAARRASSVSLTLLLPQWPEKRPNVVSECRPLLHRGEVAAARHDCPTADVGVSALGQRPWYTEDFTRELAIACRHGDPAAFRDRPWSVHAEVIRK